MPDISHNLKRIHDMLRRADRVLIVSHKKPDGDTIGASAAFLNWCLREQKQTTIFCRDVPPNDFRYLDALHVYTSDPAVFEQAYDVVIVFDSGDLAYCGIDRLIPKLPPGYALVNIDHHATNTRFAHVNIVDTNASSTAEIAYRFFAENGIRIDHAIATCLLTGMCTDTSNFSNAATNPRVLDAASDLLAQGGRFYDILTHVWQNQSTEALRLWGRMLSRLRHHRDYDVVSTYILESDIANTESDLVSGIANFLNATVHGADTILILKETGDGQVKGSFRSLKRDVTKLARLLGGGGHTRAAGFTVTGRIVEDGSGIPRIVSGELAS